MSNLHVDLAEVLPPLSSAAWEHFILVAELEVSLGTARRVLWTVSVETVWQQHYKAVLDVPLGFTGG